MSIYAVGKKAYGFCDRCGFRYPLKKLRSESVAGVRLNNRICPTCWDGDHPQNFQHQLKVDDALALRDPRPDLSLAESRAISVTVIPLGVIAYGRTGIEEVLTP